MQVLEFGDGHTARVARPRQFADAASAVSELGLGGGRRVLVVVGGASGLDEHGKKHLRALFSQVLVPAAIAWNAAVVDGGTDSGVMQLFGQALRTAGASCPLVGVAVEEKVTCPVTPQKQAHGERWSRITRISCWYRGSSWGDESPWLARVATEIAGSAPSVTVLINGGEIAFQDVANSVAADRPVLAVKGTGRAADRIAAALNGDPTDAQAAQLAGSGLVTAVSWPEGAAVRTALEKLATARQ